MKRTYISPSTMVFSLQGRTLICQSIAVNGEVRITDANDIGFVKDNSNTVGYSVWDDDWSR